ncbi:DNA recombination protein RmuC [Echinimonas agarilytica]|uniref:DNA recombination protein RmuC n=1 Tax=Echinimonas agarilytica TaxID=1215918 RepID=A0AA41W772_9GAMM|nr:DNA recombination protein RmuC [Echinimonas agarilytica]MCM2679911.1 DNA recombination protein RmuC [Echinimonas agarilytica]
MLQSLTPQLWLALAVSSSVVVGLFTWLFTRSLWKTRVDAIQQLNEQQLLALQQAHQGLNSDYAVAKDSMTQLQNSRSQLQVEIARLEASEKASFRQIDQLQVVEQEFKHNEIKLQQHLSDVLRERDTLQERYQNQTEALTEKQRLLEASEQRLAQEFENLANRIFEKKTQAFQASSENGLEALLKPFREQISGFQQQVSQKNEADLAQQALLKKELDDLKTLNLKMSDDAINLTKALKGDSKTQGNWGEVVLQRLLDQSGLKQGREYELQVALKNEHGKRYQPDVIIHLPQEKDIIIDSKVSLTAYEKLSSSDDEEIKKQALQQHVASVRGHIRELSAKNYQDLEGVRTLDYVLMFVPIEAAFVAALETQSDLIKHALDNNIMLVSPTNLMVALRTINNIWRVEQQNQNALEIAQRAGKLYDKFVGFIEDLDKVGVALGRATKDYESAKNKLESGTGNLVRQATLLKELGVRSNKQIDSSTVEKSSSENSQKET